VQQLTGDYPAATASLTQALQLFRDLGERAGQAEASVNLGELLYQSSGYREACRHLDFRTFAGCRDERGQFPVPGPA
jgi:hypothetical protein